MTTAELTSQFDFLVNSVDRQNADILQKAVDALNKVLHPKAKKRITKDEGTARFYDSPYATSR
ncbi:MAG: hypothetical protein GXY64_03490 [Bacteroidales bacterium]|nr:hypothetical protein [Bacteroidales bacterium]